MSSSENNKNTCTGNSHAIMSLVDENKDDIPEGLYLNLCNLLKKQNEEEGKEDRFYKVTYLYSSPGQKGEPFWDMYLRVGNEILKLSEPEYRNLQDDLTNKGYSYFLVDRLAQQLVAHSYVRTINNGECEECDRCEECSSSEATTCLISRCCIVNIKPA